MPDPRSLVPSCTVVVPTYGRPDMIAGCIDALRQQTLPPRQIVVVCRDADADSRAVVAGLDGIEVALVERPGLAAALLAGIRQAHGDVVVTTDDDARGRPDWLATLLSHYADPAVGAVGGRDIVHHDWGFEEPTTKPVGMVTWYGRMWGNHHLGQGRPRDVHILKGVNLSARRELVGCPANLRGDIAVAVDLAMSLYVHERGHRVVYDPNAVVDHYPAPRAQVDARVRVGERRPDEAIRDSAFNVTYALASLAPRMRWRRAAYAWLVGDRGSVGLVRELVARVRREPDLVGTWPICRAAVAEAVRASKRDPLVMVDPRG